jgi:hypothetical protein
VKFVDLSEKNAGKAERKINELETSSKTKMSVTYVEA